MISLSEGLLISIVTSLVVSSITTTCVHMIFRLVHEWRNK